MNTYTYNQNTHLKNVLLNKIIELPTNKKQEYKDTNIVGIKINENICYTLGRMDPNHISNTPPNHFMDTLKKRIDVYYSSHDACMLQQMK